MPTMPYDGDGHVCSTQTPASKPKRGNRELARTGGLIAFAVLMTLFAVFNLEKVKVSWVFGSGQVPLIVVIVLSVLRGGRVHALRRAALRQAPLVLVGRGRPIRRGRPVAGRMRPVDSG